jgi:hypothetical protein
MITVLEAIRWELATLRLRVSCLEQAEVVLGPLYEPMELCQPAGSKHGAKSTPSAESTPSTESKSSMVKSAHRNPSRRNVTRAQVREHVIAHAPITRRELIEALNCPPDTMDKKLRRLVADGEIGVDGQRSGRRYRSPDTSEIVSLPSVRPSELSASRMSPDRGVYPMYDAIVDLDGATTEQLMQRTGLPTNLVVEQGRRLLQLGLVRFTGAGNTRVWMPTQSEIARDAAVRGGS